MIDVELIAYTAGLIDGEGTVGLVRNRKQDPYRRPYISVSSTTYEMMTFLKEHYDGYIINQKTYKAHHKQAWMWRLPDTKSLALLKQILPYLIEPEKRWRATLIVEEYKSVTPRNGHYTEEQKLKKEDFEYRFFHPKLQ